MHANLRDRRKTKREDREALGLPVLAEGNGRVEHSPAKYTCKDIGTYTEC